METEVSIEKKSGAKTAPLRSRFGNRCHLGGWCQNSARGGAELRTMKRLQGWSRFGSIFFSQWVFIFYHVLIHIHVVCFLTVEFGHLWKRFLNAPNDSPYWPSHPHYPEDQAWLNHRLTFPKGVYSFRYFLHPILYQNLVMHLFILPKRFADSGAWAKTKGFGMHIGWRKHLNEYISFTGVSLWNMRAVQVESGTFVIKYEADYTFWIYEKICSKSFLKIILKIKSGKI